MSDGVGVTLSDGVGVTLSDGVGVTLSDGVGVTLSDGVGSVGAGAGAGPVDGGRGGTGRACVGADGVRTAVTPDRTRCTAATTAADVPVRRFLEGTRWVVPAGALIRAGPGTAAVRFVWRV